MKKIVLIQIKLLRFLEIYQEAADLYGLIHARFILTPKGFFYKYTHQ